MNTGVQRSGATPPAARTTTTQASGTSRATRSARARTPPGSRWPTRSPTSPPRRSPELRDLEAKVTRAMKFRGARYLHVLVPCPLGWGARRTGDTSGSTGWRARPACSRSSRPSTARSRASPRSAAGARRGIPAAADAATPPLRARPPRRRDRSHPGHGRPQHRRYGLLEEGDAHDDLPFAITLEAGSSLANKTGSWRTERPVYSSCCPRATKPARPARPSRSGSTTPRRRLRGRLAADHGRQPIPAVMGRVCYHPCETACNRAQLDKAVGINSVERFLGDHAMSRAGPCRHRGAAGRRVLVVGAGPSGLSAAYHLALLGHEVTIRTPPESRRHDAIRHPALPAAARVLDAEIERILPWASSSSWGSTVERHQRAMRDGASTRSSWPWARSRPPGLHAGRRLGADPRRRLAAARHRGRASPAAGPRVIVYGGGNTAMDAARTARRLGAADAVIVYRRTRDRMPAHDIEVAEATEEGVHDAVAVHHQAGRRRRDGSRRCGSTRPASRSRPVSSRSWPRTASCWRSARRPTSALLDGVPGVEFTDGTVRVGPNMMTGHPGIFAGGRHGPGRAHRDRGDRARQEGRPEHRRVAARPATTNPGRPARAGRPSPAQHVVLRRRPADRPAGAGGRPPGSRPSTRSSGGLDEATALFEARRCLSCGNCFECDNCYGVCPDNAVIKLGRRASATRSTSTTARAAASAPPSARAAPSNAPSLSPRGDQRPRGRTGRRRSGRGAPAPRAP